MKKMCLFLSWKKKEKSGIDQDWNKPQILFVHDLICKLQQFFQEILEASKFSENYEKPCYPFSTYTEQ